MTTPRFWPLLAPVIVAGAACGARAPGAGATSPADALLDANRAPVFARDSGRDAARGEAPGGPSDGPVERVATGPPALDATSEDAREPGADGTASDVGTIDPVRGAAPVERLRNGFGFTEGPVWIASRGFLLFSDLNTHTIHRFTPPATFAIFRQPSHRSNGLALDPLGRLVVCETATRRVTRTTFGGETVVLTDNHQGQPYTRPNDVIVRSDGNIYFTDVNVAVYRIDPRGQVHLVSNQIRPNGIALSPDERTLYVTHQPRALWQFPLDDRGEPGPGRKLAELSATCDGMAVDDHGNLYTTVDDGIEVLAPTGVPWGLVPVPERPANCTFGGADRRTLFITARTGLYQVRMPISGLP